MLNKSFTSSPSMFFMASRNPLPTEIISSDFLKIRWNGKSSKKISLRMGKSQLIEFAPLERLRLLILTLDIARSY